MSIPLNLGGTPATLPATTTQTPSIGQLVYLASYVFQVGVTAVQTMADTPNQYSANIGIMGDAGEMNLDPLTGPAGPAGVADFTLRDQTDTLPIVNNLSELPTYLTDTAEDIGKYWLLDTLNEFGFVIMVTANVWYGTEWRVFMMGTYGPPGPAPDIQLTVQDIQPTIANPATGLAEPVPSFVITSGPTTAPSWDFQLAVPAGPSGPIGLVAHFPDVDEQTVAPSPENVLMFNGQYNTAGYQVWEPKALDQGIIGPFSMPESAFNAYDGFSQQAAIGSFAIPPQPFPWTPIVWGHMGGGGIALSGNSSMIGCKVLLGDPTAGLQIARGLGNTLGEVNVMPHYSSAANTSGSITPQSLVDTFNSPQVPANHTGTEGTLYVSLWNDGALGAYLFSPADAQLFIMLIPVNPPYKTIVESGGGGHAIMTGPIAGHGTLTGARIFAVGKGALPGHVANLHGHGALHATANSIKAIFTEHSFGHGRLTAAARMFSTQRTAALHGSGLLTAFPGYPAAPLFDSVGGGSTGSSSPATLTEHHNISAGPGGCVIAAVTTYFYETATVTCGGTPMTSLGFVYNDNSAFSGGVQLFYLTNPPIGPNVAVTANFGSAPSYAILNTLSFYNIHTVGAAQTTYGTSKAMTQAVAGSVPGLVAQAFSCWMFGGSQTVTNYNQHSEYNATIGATVAMVLGFGGGDNDMTFTATSSESNNYAGIAVLLT